MACAFIRPRSAAALLCLVLLAACAQTRVPLPAGAVEPPPSTRDNGGGGNGM
jgi:hypothetical protein